MVMTISDEAVLREIRRRGGGDGKGCVAAVQWCRHTCRDVSLGGFSYLREFLFARLVTFLACLEAVYLTYTVNDIPSLPKEVKHAPT